MFENPNVKWYSEAVLAVPAVPVVPTVPAMPAVPVVPAVPAVPTVPLGTTLPFLMKITENSLTTDYPYL